MLDEIYYNVYIYKYFCCKCTYEFEREESFFNEPIKRCPNCLEYIERQVKLENNEK